MNRKQIQLNVCKALLENNMRCRGGFLNENEYAVTIDGYVAYVLDINQCIFDVSKIPTIDTIKKLFEDVENDVEIKKTNTLYENAGRLIEKYTGGNLEIFADVKFTKMFKGFRFFANSQLGRIIVKDNFNRIIALFLPVKFKPEEVKGV